LTEFLFAQYKKLPYPSGDFSGQTVIVTGSNCGLGLEVARHFTRLNAGHVILACRNSQKGEAAKADIEKTTKRKNVVEVWPLDLSSYDSVKAFCTRAKSLERLDIVIENAGIATPTYEDFEGCESTITVNVLSTFLMVFLLLPKLKETAERFNVIPRLTIVTSDAHQMANFRERTSTDIFAALGDSASKFQADRYNTSKLLEILIVQELAPNITASSKSGKPSVIVNCVNPGYCVSELQRHAVPVMYFLVKLGGLIVARSTEVGSRTLFAGAIGGEETHGQYMSACEVKEPSAFVRSKDGEETRRKVYQQLLVVLEGIESGVTNNV